MNDDLLQWIWLGSIRRIPPHVKKKLIEFYDSPKIIWKCGKTDLMDFPDINARIYEELINKEYRLEAQMHLEQVIRNNINVVTIRDKEYPPLLNNIYDPPIVLYTKGKMDSSNEFIAVVGSRKATVYGAEMAEVISSELSRLGFCIISGMARGIDSYAHKGALYAGGATAAILGCGPDIVYPPENTELMNRIEKSGIVISEYLPGEQPLPFHFIARNRIISGMSIGTVVVEAGIKSGSLITASFALEQGREVFAVPGNANSRNSSGTNRLIKDGAKIVTGVDDILEEFVYYRDKDLYKKNYDKKDTIKEYIKDIGELEIIEAIRDQPLNIDMISKVTGFPVEKALSILTKLEIKGFVQQSGGKIYRLRKLF